MPNGTGAKKWVGSIAVTAALIFTAVLVNGEGTERDLVRGSADGGPETVQFTSSGQWTAPPGVTRIAVRAIGGRGGGKSGGKGLDMRLDLTIPLGATLEILVAEDGRLRSGGGCSAIYVQNSGLWSAETRLVLVAPGGGAQGWTSGGLSGGRGGDAGLMNGLPGGDAMASSMIVATDPATGTQFTGLPSPAGGAGGGASAGAAGQGGFAGEPMMMGSSGRTMGGGRGGAGAAITDGALATLLKAEPALLPTLSYSPSAPVAGGAGGDGGCGYFGGGGGAGGGINQSGGGGGGGTSWVDVRNLVLGANNSAELAAIGTTPSVTITWTPVIPSPEVTDPAIDETPSTEPPPDQTPPDDSTTTTSVDTGPLPGEDGVAPEDTLPPDDTSPVTGDSTGSAATTPGASPATTQSPVLTLAPKPGSTPSSVIIPTATTNAQSAPRFTSPAAYPITAIMQVPRALKVRGAKVDKKSRGVCRTLTQFVITISKGTCRLTVTITSGKKKTKVPIQFTVQ